MKTFESTTKILEDVINERLQSGVTVGEMFAALSLLKQNVSEVYRLTVLDAINLRLREQAAKNTAEQVPHETQG